MGDKAKAVAVLATLDTKGDEVSYLVDKLASQGRRCLVIDIGVLGTIPFDAEVTRVEVARNGGTPLEDLVRSQDPGESMKVMGQGALHSLQNLLDSEAVDAVVCIAGGKGTALFSDIVESLPFTLPKVVVTSGRSAVIGDLAGRSNTVIIPTVLDLMGVNSFSVMALDQAATVAAEARYSPVARRAKPNIGISSFGVTTPAAMRCVDRLAEMGYVPLVFPANGAGGKLLERFIREDLLDGVIDLTTTELADEIVGGEARAGVDRFRVVAQANIPAWLSAGAVDMVNFGRPETIPSKFKGRTFYSHSSRTTLMRTSPDENYTIGKSLAEHVSEGQGPRRIVRPVQGFSDYDRAGQPFYDPAADSQWWKGITDHVSPEVELEELDLHINSPEFADLAVDWIVEHVDLANLKEDKDVSKK